MYTGSILGLALSPHMIELLHWPSVFYVFGSLGVVWFVLWGAQARPPKPWALLLHVTELLHRPSMFHVVRLAGCRLAPGVCHGAPRRSSEAPGAPLHVPGRGVHAWTAALCAWRGACGALARPV